ncbi:MAG: glycine--tRNA ligase [Candidatus Paceibacterota bacterium]
MTQPTLNDIVSLAKRRGFVFPGSEIYGGLANTYDFGPLGVELLRNIINHWWNYFVTKRSDMFGLDSAILMSPKVWEASGHTASFTDALVDCKACHTRARADHLIEDAAEKQGKSIKVEGQSIEELSQLIKELNIACPNCGAHDWTEPREFNLLFETHIGIVEESQSLAYLRGEIAQGMFVNFKNVLNTMRPKLPFGIAQTGKAFRNEITLGNFIFRTLEFNLAEFEYFFDPESQSWEELFEYWKQTMQEFAEELGLSKDKLSWRTHTDDERSHYSTRTEDLDYQFPFGSKEMFGLAYRTDYDLKNHMEKSGVDLNYTDPQDPQHKFIPHVVEPTFGINRIFLALLTEAYRSDGERTWLALPAKLAPFKAAVFPLVKNKPELVDKAKSIFEQLSKTWAVDWDDRGNIGKRYLSQDEIGTPFCITIDYQTLEDDTVTLRDRETTKQERLSLAELEQRLANMLG